MRPAHHVMQRRLVARGHQAVKMTWQRIITPTRSGTAMRKPSLDPDVADTAPADSALTPYDHEHAITYLRLLDAADEGADWKEVAQIVLHIDPAREPVRAQQAYESHLTRARWMTEQGYRLLLMSGWPYLN